MSEPNVVSLHGEDITMPGEAVPETVALAENLLRMAQSGEIKYLAAIMVHHDEAVSCRNSVKRVTYRLVGMMQALVVECCNRLNQ